MTETSSLFHTNAPVHHPAATTVATPTPPRPNGTGPNPTIQDEEEYTIKCVCIYADDDGNTVYCPKCDSWQHIQCYYHGKDVPDEHFCKDCGGDSHRDLDGKKATDRQRRAREDLDIGDRKAKRPASKTSKKKQKDAPISEQVNGWVGHERQESLSISRDQPPPAKKPKTSHRTSGSIVSIAGESRKRANSNQHSYPSPSRSPQDLYRFPPVPQYSQEFLELYDRDDWSVSPQNQQTVAAVNQLKRWSGDDSLVVKDQSQQPNMRSPFVATQQDLDRIPWPRVSVLTHQNTHVEIDGKHPTWRYLRLEEPISKDTLVGEIRGDLGTLEEYCQQLSSTNRWAELAHPDPFVFFHPHMNIYIDSRTNGTQFRFLRRSCQPNVTLKTYVNLDAEDAEERHCFVANQDIAAGTELTAAWFINASMFDLKSGKEDSEQLEGQRCEWVSRVLANFGDCACDQTQCRFARLDRRLPIKNHNGHGKPMHVRRRKLKGKQAASPNSTGQATNSRAGSEAVNGIVEDDHEDRKSVSESSRSEGHSRDITPVNPPSLDADPVLGADLTARELRKLQNIEKQAAKVQKHTSVKKKKRTSAGSTLNTLNSNGVKQSESSPTETDDRHGSPFARTPVYKDNNMPSTKRPLPKSARDITYVSVGVQTEQPEISLEELARRKKKYRFISPRERLIMSVCKYNKRRQEDDARSGLTADVIPSIDGDWLASMAKQGSTYAGDCMVQGSPTPELKTDPTPFQPTITFEAAVKSDQHAVRLVHMPLPSQAAHTQVQFKAPIAPRLHLSTLPPVPAFPNGNVVTPGSGGSSSSVTTPGTVQSPPFLHQSTSTMSMSSSVVAPSPIKKKLSLGDYMSRRNLATTPITEKSQTQSLMSTTPEKEPSSHEKPSGSAPALSSESLTAVQPTTSTEDGDVQMKDNDDDDDYYSPPGASPDVTDQSFVDPLTTRASTSGVLPSSGSFAPEVANVLAQLAQFKHPVNKV